ASASVGPSPAMDAAWRGCGQLAVLAMLPSLRAAARGSGRSVASASPGRWSLCVGDGRQDASGGGSAAAEGGGRHGEREGMVRRWLERRERAERRGAAGSGGERRETAGSGGERRGV